jgi:hypothetical protein
MVVPQDLPLSAYRVVLRAILMPGATVLPAAARSRMWQRVPDTVTITDAGGCICDIIRDHHTASQCAFGKRKCDQRRLLQCSYGKYRGYSYRWHCSSYQYLWSSTPSQNTATASNLGAGSYTVTVTDAHSCTTTSTYTVTQPATGISLSTSSTAATCGASNGSATVSLVSGTGTFTYAWSGGGTGTTYSGLAAGTYTVTATNTSGCSATSSLWSHLQGRATPQPRR